MPLLTPILMTALASFSQDQPKTRPATVVFLGDSLTAGYGLPKSQSFPDLLAPRLEKAGWRGVNAGVSGDTSSGALRRLDWVLKPGADLVFLCIGANDGLRGVPPATTEANLRELVARIRKRGAKVVLAGMRLPENYGPEHLQTFEAIYPRVARELKVPLLPFLLEGVAMRPELNQADGVHPNARGQQQVANHVWSFIRPFLSEGGKPKR